MRVHGIGKNGDDEADPFALVRRKLPTSLRVDYFVGAFLDGKELPDRALDISRIRVRGMLDRLGFFLLWLGGLRLGSAVRAAKAEKSADENEGSREAQTASSDSHDADPGLAHLATSYVGANLRHFPKESK
jgi:hypothetical protein